MVVQYASCGRGGVEGPIKRSYGTARHRRRTHPPSPGAAARTPGGPAPGARAPVAAAPAALVVSGGWQIEGLPATVQRAGRQGHVYTEIVPDCSKPTLQGIIRGRVDPRTVINSDGWRGYHGLVDLGYGHVRVDHARDEFTKGTVHLNGIEGFWGLAKVRLTQFKGLPKHTFHLHLKETEWRYNHRRADKYNCLLQYLRKNPLS